MKLDIVILAAGQGTRMQSAIPKVLHQIAGVSLLEHIVRTTMLLSHDTTPIVVYGHQGEQLKQSLKHPVIWVHQTQQLGTGHAVQQALPHLTDSEYTFILYADVPLVSFTTLQKILEKTTKNTIGIVTATVPNPTGLGRIIRNQQNDICKIIEEKDASDSEQTIHEINTGIYLIPTDYLKKQLPTLKNHNAQNEFYITDMIEIALKDDIKIVDVQPDHYQETLGINTREQLAQLERFYQIEQAKKFLQNGVTLIDPNRFDVRGDVNIGKDSVIDINVILEGKVKIGERCFIGPHCILRNVTLGNDVEIRAHSILDGAMVSDHCMIGPFARIRPDTTLASHCHIGNFVEIKKSAIGFGTKINHLTYIGDSEIGKQVNIGAGTITCNYDGKNKHKTTIEDHAFIGSNSALIAPITIHTGATIGAGSTITRDAPANQLTLTRVKQKSIINWQRPIKTEKEKT